MKAAKRRLCALEQAKARNQETIINSDGAEYGLEPIEGGWTLFINRGRIVKILPTSLWDAW